MTKKTGSKFNAVIRYMNEVNSNEYNLISFSPEKYTHERYWT